MGFLLVFGSQIEIFLGILKYYHKLDISELKEEFSLNGDYMIYSLFNFVIFSALLTVFFFLRKLLRSIEKGLR